MDYRPHDLLRLSPDVLEIPDDAPAWAVRGLARERPWVVLRRAVPEPGTVPVGVRGSARRERWAFSAPLSCVLERVSPEALARGRAWRSVRTARGVLPAVAALEAVAGLLEGRGLVWGPGGSVGYELASGLPVVTAGSDLDLILRCPRRLPHAAARGILEDLASLPVRADAQIDTGTGSVALAEWGDGGEVLLRRAGGPVLTDDPWSEPGRSRSTTDVLMERQGP